MVYNNYPFQQYYPSANTVAYPQPRQPITSVAYVQGENAAKAYPVTPGQIMYLFDTESNLMYIKSTDQSGIPSPIRVFRYDEEIQNGKENQSGRQLNTVSREEFEKFKEEIRNEVRRRRKPDEQVKEASNA